MADIDVRVPAAFATLVRTSQPRTRIRSATACYLDLGDVAIAAPDGGWLIHFLSDQQWVCHWLLHVASNGSEAVVSTSAAYGFAIVQADGGFGAGRPDRFVADPDDRVVADSFSGFLYRLWIENEIWFALTSGSDLTAEQRRYAEHYRSRTVTSTASATARCAP